MELPYMISSPTWTSNGFYSMTTRPGLAVHRNQYKTTPRLFPVHTTAQQLCLPVNPSPSENGLNHHQSFSWEGVSKLRKTADVLKDMNNMSFSNRSLKEWEITKTPISKGPTFPDHIVMDCLQEEHSLKKDDTFYLSNATPEWLRNGENTFNPLSCMIDHDKSMVVFTSSGSRNGMRACVVEIEVDENGRKTQNLRSDDKSHFFRHRLQFDQASVRDILSVGCVPGSNERPRILATTAENVSIATISEDKSYGRLEWLDEITIPSLLSCAINPVFPDDFSVLSSDGLFSGTVESFHAQKKVVNTFESMLYDIQPIADTSKYYSLNYGMHPRTLYLGNQKEIALCDIRSDLSKMKRNVLVDLNKDWGLPSFDRQIACFEPLPGNRRSKIIVATKTCLNYIDIRMPRTPFLDWTLSVPLPVDHMTVTSMTSVDGYDSDIIALSSRQQHYLEVFHAIDIKGTFTQHKPFQSDEMGNPEPPGFPAQHVLWSDLPLSHLQQLKPSADLVGMALMPHSNSSLVSVVQWSPEDGLIAQLLDVRTQKDESSVSFESPPHERPYLDNNVNIANWQKVYIRSGQYEATESMLHPVTRSVPGSYLHQRTRRIFVEDARNLQTRLINDEEDEVADDEKDRLTRPYLGDLESVRHMRELGGDDTGEMDNLLDSIGSGRTLDEIARVTRSGMAHSSTPVNPTLLRDVIESSPFVKWYDVEWHAGCSQQHQKEGPAVTTDDPLPAWIQRRIYYESATNRPHALSIVNVPEESQYGQMLTRMQEHFFNDEEPANSS